MKPRNWIVNSLRTLRRIRKSEEWRDDPIPPFDDGRLLVVVLNDDSHLEHYRQPVIVTAWADKLKTTVEPIRLSREDVKKWHPWRKR